MPSLDINRCCHRHNRLRRRRNAQTCSQLHSGSLQKAKARPFYPASHSSEHTSFIKTDSEPSSRRTWASIASKPSVNSGSKLGADTAFSTLVSLRTCQTAAFPIDFLDHRLGQSVINIQGVNGQRYSRPHLQYTLTYSFVYLQHFP